jgi:D-sedoheptulose 7-phosphate isomerase
MKKEAIRGMIFQSIEAHRSVDGLVDQIDEAANLMIQSINQGNKIISCGNGGSAAQAQHFSAELVGRFEKERKSLPSISLTTDTSNLTAIGNDYGYDQIFKRQLASLGTKGDVLICLSSSGNSPNLTEAINEAKTNGFKVINLLGKDGGRMKGSGDLDIIINSENTARIQECHILILHILAKLVEDSII